MNLNFGDCLFKAEALVAPIDFPFTHEPIVYVDGGVFSGCFDVVLFVVKKPDVSHADLVCIGLEKARELRLSNVWVSLPMKEGIKTLEEVMRAAKQFEYAHPTMHVTVAYGDCEPNVRQKISLLFETVM